MLIFRSQSTLGGVISLAPISDDKLLCGTSNGNIYTVTASDVSCHVCALISLINSFAVGDD